MLLETITRRPDLGASHVRELDVRAGEDVESGDQSPVMARKMESEDNCEGEIDARELYHLGPVKPVRRPDMRCSERQVAIWGLESSSTRTSNWGQSHGLNRSQTGYLELPRQI